MTQAAVLVQIVPELDASTLNPYGEEDEGMQGGIPLPMAPFGIPKFDNGERFDLKVRCHC